jgi:Na+-driven multidrug efflux pump
MSETVSDVTEAPETSELVERTALVMYGSMTLLGVLDAASYKNVVTTHVGLTLLVVVTSLSLVIAHAWSTVVARRLIRREKPNREAVVNQMWLAGALLAPAAFVLVVIATSLPFDEHETNDDVVSTIVNAQYALLIAIFVMGTLGARRAGLSWPRTLMWGLIDVGIGVLIVLLKDGIKLLGS